MRTMMELGLTQGFLPPPLRPASQALRGFGFSGSDDEVLAAAAEQDLALLRAACSASSMWRANAATVLAAPDTGDGRVHLVTANLAGRLRTRRWTSCGDWSCRDAPAWSARSGRSS